MRLHNSIAATPMTRFFDHSKYTISFGFILVLTLLTAVAVIGLTHMAAINGRMNVIVNEQNVKTDLVGNMRNAARERSISLHRMALMSDPFDRDEEYLYFRKMAWDFLKARTALETMHLSQVESKTLAESEKLVSKPVAIQEEVYYLITDDHLAEANRRLLTEAVPAQNQVLAELSALLDYQRQATRAAVKIAQSEYERAFYSMLGLGLLSLGFGVAIAVAVIRRTNDAEQALFQEKERAEVTLHSIADAVITTSANGTVQYMNPVAEKLTGWPVSEARGLVLETVFSVVNEVTREKMPNLIIGCGTEESAKSVDSYGLLVARGGTEYAVENSAAPIAIRRVR